jgi:hypothetical protein
MAELDDFSRYARIIPKEQIPALSRDLKKIPDFSWLLGEPHPEIERLQGDFLNDFPTVYLDEKGDSRSRKFTVMILNNTCDLPDGRLDFVTAAPVVDFNRYLEFERDRRLRAHTHLGEHEKAGIEDSVQELARVIRHNDKTELLFVPKFGEFQNGALVLLHLVCSVSTKIYHDALRAKQRLASFTQTGFYFLLIKLTTHIARAESTQVMRKEVA